MTRKLPTGIEVLDRKLDGGIPAGTVIVLSAPPVSQSELFLYELASVRETLYFTTERTASAVEDSLNSTGRGKAGVDVVRIEDEDPTSQIEDAISDLQPETNVIVDPTRLLERQGTPEYRSFLNSLCERISATDSIAMLHCLDGRTVPAERDVTEYMGDIVFELTTTRTGESLESHLAVPKFRGGQPFEDVIKLNLTAGVTIDVSRKIA